MLARDPRASCGIARPDICVSWARYDTRRFNRMLFSPFFFIYLLICVALLAGLFILIELEVISYAFLVLGFSPRAAILALFSSLLGSYINIPLYTVPSDAVS